MSDAEDEKQVNELASELLMPTSEVRKLIPNLPVVSQALKRLAQKSKVSVLSAAIRVCNLTEELGLENAAVANFTADDTLTWQWSTTLKMSAKTACRLLRRTRESENGILRYEQDEGQTVVSSIIENKYFGSATLFVQLLPSDLGMELSHHEKRQILEESLFRNNVKLQQRVSGLFGAHKGRINNHSVESAIDLFWDKNYEKLKLTAMNSEEGREYVELRISEWF